MDERDIDRPAGWSDRTWADLERIIRVRSDWHKPAENPEVFGLTSMGVALAAYLLDRGCLPWTDMPRDGTMTTTVPIDGRSVQAVFGPRPGLVEKVGEYADEPATWRALATLRQDVGTRAVHASDGMLTVEVAMPFTLIRGSRLLDILAADVGRIRNALDTSDRRRGGGYADLVSSFVGAELAVPHLPPTLRHRLRREDEWCWTTRRGDAQGRMVDYLMETSSLLERAVEDHVTVSHGGHGKNSYALTWRMAYGPLAFIVQDGWGGWGGGPRDNGSLAEIFAHASTLLRLAEERMTSVSEPPSGAWMRPVVVACSPLRGIMSCGVWDPVRGERTDVKLDPGRPWEQIAQLVETSWVPDLGVIRAR